jgi:hypothetical protein
VTVIVCLNELLLRKETVLVNSRYVVYGPRKFASFLGGTIFITTFAWHFVIMAWRKCGKKYISRLQTPFVEDESSFLGPFRTS